MSLPKMPDYANNTIYKLVSDNLPGVVYIGHTTTSLKIRLARHVNDLNCSSRRIIEAGSYHIEELEKWPCKTKEEALWRERWWIENTPCINEVIPIRTEEERKLKDREKWNNRSQEQQERKKETNKQWQQNNPEKCNEFSKKWRANPDNAETHRKSVKNWKKNNRAKANELKRISAQRPAVKAKIKAHRSERVQCLMCGAFGGRGDKSTHTRACYTRFCKAFDIDADFKGVRGVASE